MSHKFTYRGTDYRSVAEACRELGLSYAAVMSRVREGLPVQDALDYPSGWGQPCIDHTGRRFRSVSQMCEAWGQTPGRVCYRRYSLGWTLEKALTVARCQREVYHDHLGRTYGGLAEMCGEYGIPTRRYYDRHRHGRSLKDALTTPVRPRGRRRKS